MMVSVYAEITSRSTSHCLKMNHYFAKKPTDPFLTDSFSCGIVLDKLTLKVLVYQMVQAFQNRLS